MKIIINGCNGKMGRVLIRLLSEDNQVEIVAGIDRDKDKFNNPFPVYGNPSECTDKCDIIIDFSHYTALPDLIDYCVNKEIPLLVATTGLTGEIISKLTEASKSIPIFQTANMSLGVNVITKLAQAAAKGLGDAFDIEIIEAHHNKKVDSPSGTAYMIANAINEVFEGNKDYVFGRHGKADSRKVTDIGIHAIRGGNMAGEHTIIFAGQDEIIEIKHTALSKDIFVLGAIKAAKFLVKQEKGFYNINDVLN